MMIGVEIDNGGLHLLSVAHHNNDLEDLKMG